MNTTIPLWEPLSLLYVFITFFCYIWSIGHQSGRKVFWVLNSLLPFMFLPGIWEFDFSDWMRTHNQQYNRAILLMRPMLTAFIILSALLNWHF
jgi:hypothetical protein